MKFETFFLAAFVAGAAAVPAQASCWTNPAICQAICGSDCCDGGGFTSVTNQEALSEFSLEDLQAEVKGTRATSRNRSFRTIIDAEIKARSMSTPRTGAATIKN